MLNFKILKKEKMKMKKYICNVCGYIYDPEEHDNIEFEDLKQDWLCPICAAPKSEFEEIL